MESSIRKSLDEKQKGFFIGDRLILPFKCQILKIIAGNHIYTELVGSSHIKLSQEPVNTSIYLRSTGKLSNFLGSYKVIKLVACEYDKDLTDQSNHIKLICEMEDSHKVSIHEPSDDMLFIE